LVDGRLTAGHGRALLAAPASDRLKLAHRAANDGLSVRALEKITGAVKTPASGRVRELSPDEAEFESRLRERFGTHVALVRGGKGGKIEFRFANEDELMRLSDLLLEP
jgi:ParB family chromosome partitioning protein